MTIPRQGLASAVVCAFAFGRLLNFNSWSDLCTPPRYRFIINAYVLCACVADHGAIFFSDGQRPDDVNFIAMAKDGPVHSLSLVRENAKRRVGLIWISATERVFRNQ